ncbi:diguanylate cyclase [Nocardiopsis sp. TSRI0078]|uniref:sensor domain-containing diguanylate cyclase n=1 Tax=unclassified Nocardiopsis TaxID=2649073 RepID=UPI00093B8B43|nr:GGDEF domain-containing protein [Nocardiopsis sp. TSRI0078]OKI21282.1 diguanylate cyclase [Nocardiopsis sp. TSRI0078]
MSISEKPVAPGENPAEEQRRWPILQHPRILFAYLVFLLTAALFLFGVSAALVTFTWRDLATFAALVVCAAVCVEAIRRLGMPGVPAGFARDLLGAWWFPAVLLLPPVYSLLIPIPVFILLQFRARRALVHRRVFNGTSIALSGFLTSVVWHAVQGGGIEAGLSGVPDAHESLATGTGVLVAVLCCAGFTILNTFIVVVAARTSNGPGQPLRPMWDREAFTVDAVELCVGVTVAILAHLSLFLLVIAVPPVLLLQRSLLYQQLQMAVRTDPKTGLLNAPTWEQEASVEIARAHSSRGRAAVLIIDIDHFKRVNDNHGHLFGDQVLLGVATTIAQQLRQSDLLGRFGGEEFVVLLPGSDTTEAWQAAERLRSQVGSMEIAVDEVPVSITISIGVAVIGDHGNDLVELLTAADLALYRAKETGRNRVCLPAGGTGVGGGVGGRIPGPRGGEIPGRTASADPGDPTEIP